MAKNVVIIGVSGVRGSFSEEAALAYARKNSLKKPTLRFLTTVENVLAALEAGDISLGIFPIENSNGGVVIETVYAMAAHRFSIKKMFEIDIHHNLLIVPDTTAGVVRSIVSHDQALKQCRMYLKRTWGRVKIKEYPDTAKAAEDLANGILPKTTAVIASARAAELYKLDILEESIQDLKFNYTSFVVAAPVK